MLKLEFGRLFSVEWLFWVCSNGWERVQCHDECRELGCDCLLFSRYCSPPLPVLMTRLINLEKKLLYQQGHDSSVNFSCAFSFFFSLGCNHLLYLDTIGIVSGKKKKKVLGFYFMITRELISAQMDEIKIQ